MSTQGLNIMTLKQWMVKHDIRAETACRHIGCSIYAFRKWLTGERIPRPRMQAKIMKFTNGAVTANDWIDGLKKM